MKGSISENIRKAFFLRKYKKFFNLRVRKFHFLKYKEFFWGCIVFIFSSPGLKTAPGSPIIYYSQIHQFCDNQSQKLLRLTLFSWKSPKKMLDLLKDTQSSPSPLVQCCVKSGKAMPVVARNDQGNLQPTLNKGAGV